MGPGLRARGPDPSLPSERDRPLRRAAFASDPEGWFAWLDRAIADTAAPPAGIRPAVWVDPRGHRWRVVVTHEGPEVRPALENPFLVCGELPIITALMVGRDAVHLELTSRGGRNVMRCPLGRVSIVDLGLAMLTATELSHEGVERLGEETWSAARRRWRLLRATAGRFGPASRGAVPA